MTLESKNNYSGNNHNISGKDGKSKWSIFVKGICWVFSCLIVVLLFLCCGLYFYFTPQRISDFIEKESEKYLHADVELSLADYSLFKNFPWIHIEIDSIRVVSKCLQNLPEYLSKDLPANADSLLSVRKISFDINVKSLLHKEINIKDINISKPDINIVIASSDHNNFNIIQDTGSNLKMPDIKLEEINFIPPITVSFLSLPESVDLKTIINKFSFLTKGDNAFSLGLQAIVDGQVCNFKIPDNLTMGIDLNSIVNFPNIEAQIDHFWVKTKAFNINLKCSLASNTEEITLKDALLNIASDNIFYFEKALPEEISKTIKIPAGLSGTLPIDMNVNLKSSYIVRWDELKQIDKLKLPSINADLKIADAYLRYEPFHEKPITANDVLLSLNCNFDPTNPEATNVNLQEFKMKGEGIDIEANAIINNILGEIQQISGNVKFESNLMKTLSYLIPKGEIKLNGHLDGWLTFSVNSLKYAKDGINNINLKGNINSQSLVINSGKTLPAFNINKFQSDYDIFLPKYPLNNYQGSRFKLDINSEKLTATQGPEMKAEVDGMKLNLIVNDSIAGGMNPKAILNLSVKNIHANAGGEELNAKGLNTDIKANLITSQGNGASPFSLKENIAEQEIAEKIAHTPLYIEYSGAGMLQTILNMAAGEVFISAESGYFKTPSYLYPIKFDDITMMTDLNKVRLSSQKITIGRSSFSLGANAEGIADFITSYEPVLLKGNASIDFSDVDINQLSWGYYGAALKNGNDSIFNVFPVKPFTSKDSTCVAIPRNIDARVSLRSKKAEYLQYSFSPLQTDIIIKNGNATLQHLSIGAPYCNVAVDWTYSTQNLDNIYMSLKANLDQFSFKPFYSVFPQIVKKAEELENFTGEISADIDCKFLMYPTMFMNAPSLESRFNIRGKNLEFARHGKIERITHLMLIKGDEPIHIENIDITGGFHDNILQVDPFKIKFDDYQLSFGGLNNMQGNMYYHLALEKSPFHLPFGVNLKGSFKHPEVRTGGTGFDEKLGEKISSEIEWHPDINIMAYLKHGWLLFIGQAAKYSQENEK